MFGHYADRFDRIGKLDVARLPHKGRTVRKPGQTSFGRSAPYPQDAMPPTDTDIQRGLAQLGLQVAPQQVKKLKELGGSDVLSTLLKLGARTNNSATNSSTKSQAAKQSSSPGAAPRAPAATVSAPPAAPKAEPTARIAGRKMERKETAANLVHRGWKSPKKAKGKLPPPRFRDDRKNLESVQGLLEAPEAEQRRQVVPGDDQNDKDRVVTGVQGDRHRRYRSKKLAQSKVRRKALERLKGCGHDVHRVYRKLKRRDGRVTTGSFRAGLQQLAGVRLADGDFVHLLRSLDPDETGEIALDRLKEAMQPLDKEVVPRTRFEEREEQIDAMAWQTGLATNVTKQEKMKKDSVISVIESKVQARFGTGPDRLRRMFLSLQRNGDGTISTRNLRSGLAQYGVGLTDEEFAVVTERVAQAQQNVHAEQSGEDIYFSDLVHVFENFHTESLPIDNTSRREGRAAVVREQREGDDHLYHIVSQRKNDPFHDAPKMHEAKRRRPHPRSAEQRRNAAVAKKFLSKLYEKGKSLADAFLLLDGDRDGIISAADVKAGVMSRLGFQVPKDDLDRLTAHMMSTSSRKDGITMQQFAASIEDRDHYHAYMNDIAGSGGGGELEGPLAAAVGADAVKQWTGRREHRGQLSSALTARGTLALGPQFADPHAIGVAGGQKSAKQWAAEVAEKRAPDLDSRRARKIQAEVGEQLRRRRTSVADAFLEMDVSQHGSLSYDELRHGLDRAGIHLNDSEFRLLVGRLDDNGDGLISYQNFAHAIKRDDLSASDAEKKLPRNPSSPDPKEKPIRIGMVLTTTKKNDSQNVKDALKLPPEHSEEQEAEMKQKVANSWIGEAAKILESDADDIVGQHHVDQESYDHLASVATRLKLNDTLDAKVGSSLREQYMSLGRAKSGKVTMGSLAKTLQSKGCDVSIGEMESLLSSAGIEHNTSNPAATEIRFETFKRLTSLRGLGNDVRQYDFARSIQLPPGVGHSTGNLPQRLDKKRSMQALEGHKPKHLTDAAGGARQHLRVPIEKLRKRVWRDKNLETGVIHGMMEPASAHFEETDNPMIADFNVHNHHYNTHARVKHPHAVYREHDHLQEQSLLSPGKQLPGPAEAIHDHKERRHIKSHANKDHVYDHHLLESQEHPLSIRHRDTKSSRRSQRVTARQHYQAPKNRKAGDWFKHDSTPTPSSRKNSSGVSKQARRVQQQVQHRQQSRILRFSAAPPMSPAAANALASRDAAGRDLRADFRSPTSANHKRHFQAVDHITATNMS